MYLGFTAATIIYLASFFLVFGVTSSNVRYGYEYSARELELKGTEFEIASNATAVGVPGITELSGGGFIATWIVTEVAYGNVDAVRVLLYGQRYTALWIEEGDSFLINSGGVYVTVYYGFIEGGGMVVTALSDNRFLITWVRARLTEEYRIYSQRYTSEGLPETAEYLVVNSPDSYSEPAVAALKNNRVVVVYAADGAGSLIESEGLYRETYTPAGGRSGDPALVNADRLAGRCYAGAAIISLSGGGYVVVWKSLETEGSGIGIVGQLFDSYGSKVNTQFQVNGQTGYLTVRDKLALVALKDDEFVLVWNGLGLNSTAYGIFGQRYAADGTAVGGYFQISAHTYTRENSQSAPVVASLRGGGFVVIWTRSLFLPPPVDYENNILGRIFTKDCIAVGGEINIASEGASSPAVAAFGDGFIVAWVSGNYIIIAQRFAADGTKIAIADTSFVSKSAVPLYILPPILVGLLAAAYFVTYFYYGKEIRRSL
jgi:hypothetical protein